MNYSKTSDVDLFVCCQGGDIKAYNALFDRYIAKLYRMGMRYIKDEGIVEELCMDLMLSLWERRNEIHLEGNLSAYLFKAMHNKVISYLRKQRPAIIDIDSITEERLAGGCNADDGVLLKETAGNYAVQLDRLTPQRQTAFRLSREEGMSYSDIAREMNLSTNTVKNHINAALNFLREHSVVIFCLLQSLF